MGLSTRPITDFSGTASQLAVWSTFADDGYLTVNAPDLKVLRRLPFVYGVAGDRINAALPYLKKLLHVPERKGSDMLGSLYLILG